MPKRSKLEEQVSDLEWELQRTRNELDEILARVNESNHPLRIFVNSIFAGAFFGFLLGLLPAMAAIALFEPTRSQLTFLALGFGGIGGFYAGHKWANNDYTNRW